LGGATALATCCVGKKSSAVLDLLTLNERKKSILYVSIVNFLELFLLWLVLVMEKVNCEYSASHLYSRILVNVTKFMAVALGWKKNEF
jgi:hypothetical protein